MLWGRSCGRRMKRSWSGFGKSRGAEGWERNSWEGLRNGCLAFLDCACLSCLED